MQYSANIKELGLTAGSAKTLLALLAADNESAQLVSWGFAFNSTSATEPVLVEMVKFTGATFSTPGTENTAVTPVQARGPGAWDNAAVGRTQNVAAHVRAFSNCAKEPTVGVVLKSWKVSPTSGIFVQEALGREPELPPKAELANTPVLGFRFLAGGAPTVTGFMEYVTGSS